jgi:hypothetical protein
MPKASENRKHRVKANLSNLELTRATSALNLLLYSEGKKIGELEIGRGSLYWYGRFKQTRKRISWSKFADMMDKLAYGPKS